MEVRPGDAVRWFHESFPGGGSAWTIWGSLTTWPITWRLFPEFLRLPSGGSRATGTHGPSSDWDFAVYYREHFDPDDLGNIGWLGTVSRLAAGAAESSTAGRGWKSAIWSWPNSASTVSFAGMCRSRSTRRSSAGPPRAPGWTGPT
ncbi:nucleotidyltransferase domain-containing protein [Pseudarthrobacter polychromogenes]|uniref:nucleotidyltransferase domain-containing protein n=1 Tax=Pseudarthrobacter polychromogenes TaxID=1676 RepID=UPI0035E8DAE1